jgi:hypothetical protein
MGTQLGSEYRESVLSQIPRILGLGDRNNGSITYGCFDRSYWHYKLLDLPNARFQEVTLLLVLLHQNDFDGNVYFQRRQILEWAMGAMKFWMWARNKDGSANEVYPHERSFCATAFGLYAVTEAILLMGWEVPPGLEKTADWLSVENNEAVSNQTAAAAIGLYNCFLLTGDTEYRLAAERKVEHLKASQDPTGYFPEYGGYDIGYQTVTLGHLTKYHKRSEDKQFFSYLDAAVRFVEERVAEDGSFDYSATSRKTQFLYPWGLTAMRSCVIERHLRGLRKNKVVSPSWMDDRYVIPLTTDYLEAYLELTKC